VKIIWDSKRNWTIIFLLLVIGVLVFLKIQEIQESPDTEFIVDFDLDKIKERGTLNVLLNNSSSSYFIYKGNPMGFELEILKDFAKSIGVKMEVVVQEPDQDIFELLNSGKVDIIATGIVMTALNKERIEFSEHYLEDEFVLIQQSRKPSDSLYIKSQVDLIDKDIYVAQQSSLIERLKNLSSEIGGDINIIETEYNYDELIQQLSDERILYTAAPKRIALINNTYYHNLETQLPISFPQKIGFGVRKNHPQLLTAINNWLISYKRKSGYFNLYDKYFKNSKSYYVRFRSDYFSVVGNKISPYDDLLKKYAEGLGWDWKLLAAVMYRESKFEIEAESWAGATGLMQLMPETAYRFGLDSTNINNPEDNIKAAVKYIKSLDKMWQKIEDKEERIKFILASYNVGAGHVLDAVNLTKKYNKDHKSWEEVGFFLKNKSQPKYYLDPVVKNGYCRGLEPFLYVQDVLEVYRHYVQLVKN
jgi:membrane-bound lytic murein transglycosylase F